jgi:hypothetical protein
MRSMFLVAYVVLLICHSVHGADEEPKPANKGPAPLTLRMILEEKKVSHTIDGTKVELKDLAKHLEPILKNDERGPDGESLRPVKLVVPENAPMRDVERTVMALAQVKLVNVQYVVEDAPKAIESPPTKPAVPGKAAKETVRVHVFSENDKAKLEIAGTTYAADDVEKDPTKAFPNANATVKVSYEPSTAWRDVMRVFNVCAKRGIAECGLVPLRGDPTLEK